VGLIGPTALGKTEIALCLAERLGGEIVSADSMQVYAGLPLLTNQPSPAQLARVPHHLVAVVSPTREFSVAEYALLAHAALDDVRHRERRAILEGGSGLYVRAALGGLSFGTPPDQELRRELEAEAATDAKQLATRLRSLDRETARRVDLANSRRLVRALEIVLTQGAPLSAAQRNGLWGGNTRYPHVLFALEAEREELRRRSEERVDLMLASGLVDEVRPLWQAGGLSRTLAQAIGLREVGAYLDGASSLDEAVAAMKTRTRRYVTRQLTWMRKLPDAVRIAAGGRSPADVAADIARRLI
jgi:tRNA dimethylallyltransferase